MIMTQRESERAIRFITGFGANTFSIHKLWGRDFFNPRNHRHGLFQHRNHGAGIFSQIIYLKKSRNALKDQLAESDDRIEMSQGKSSCIRDCQFVSRSELFPEAVF